MTFENFLMMKHSEQYYGTKDCMVDDFPEWQMDLEIDDWLKYGDMFAKEQSKGLLAICKDARKAINSLPIDSFGEGSYTAPNGEQVKYPIRDELIDGISKAIAKSEEA